MTAVPIPYPKGAIYQRFSLNITPINPIKHRHPHNRKNFLNFITMFIKKLENIKVIMLTRYNVKLLLNIIWTITVTKYAKQTSKPIFATAFMFIRFFPFRAKYKLFAPCEILNAEKNAYFILAYIKIMFLSPFDNIIKIFFAYYIYLFVCIT